MKDALSRFQLDRAGVRGAHVRLDAAWQELRSHGDYAGALGELLGQALEFGLVNRVTPPDELMAQVLERARVIAGKAPLSVRALKKVVRGGAALPLDEAMDLEMAQYNRLFKTQDRREGVAAFNQKRTAVFRGE